MSTSVDIFFVIVSLEMSYALELSITTVFGSFIHYEIPSRLVLMTSNYFEFKNKPQIYTEDPEDTKCFKIPATTCIAPLFPFGLFDME